MSALGRDQVVTIGLVAAFALLVTMHVVVVFGLARAKTWAKAGLALVVPPLAPWFALRGGLALRGVLWLMAAAGYGVALALARV